MEEARQFVASIRPRLVGMLSLQVGDPHVAEELAQEALTRTWAHWGKVHRHPAPEAWVYRVANNLASSWWRRRAAEQRALRRHGDTQYDSGDRVDQARDIALRNAISSLPRRQREALVLRYYLEYSVAQTADLMGTASGTVKALCHQAITKLRHELQLQDIDPSTDESLSEVDGDG